MISALVLALSGPTGSHASAQAATATVASGKTFTLLVYETEDSFRARTDPDRSAPYWTAFANFGSELAAANVLRSGGAFLPISSGRRVAMTNGTVSSSQIKPDTTGLELGGSFVIEVADMTAAEAWAAKCPATSTGMVIVRENVPMAAATGTPGRTGTTAPEGDSK
jgi:hypothetical protein